ncbi:hypothetical protein D8674_034998 [Pyrus ussuriensis x Pyrus communis]|uniref:Disease resistance protein At4g27190-like leucine-rich repeats domain-containing protein n=1 Tax=Pyrus ussuriensis x Pyrus communis TaxID=2448454 RepID=A0A5N5GGQ4_9ROSA|nr:hypothetical protein D8674_034998 [Pyrus ussuriensis x Pyrus communis]
MCGELNFFLGLQVKQSEDGIFVFQTKYASELVKKFGLHSAKPVSNPMATTTKLHKDPNGKSVDQTLYRSMIGSLLYLTASRPDISFSVGACARYQADPKESHLETVKRIIRYVSGTIDYGLHYSFETNSEIAGFSDADWAGNADDRKSTSGGCFYVGNNLVAWHSKKQNCVSLSTAEAEYIAAGKTLVINPSFSPPRTRSVKRKLFSSPSDCSASPDINFSQAVFQQMLDLNKQLSLLERFIKSSTNDLSHRISNLEQCFHRLPSHLFAPLIHISSSDDEVDFRADCSRKGSHTFDAKMLPTRDKYSGTRRHKDKLFEAILRSQLTTLRPKLCTKLQLVRACGSSLKTISHSLQMVYETLSTTQLNGFKCPNLNSVKIDSCDNLKNILLASVAKDLKQLSNLKVENCGLMEEVQSKINLFCYFTSQVRCFLSEFTEY